MSLIPKPKPNIERWLIDGLLTIGATTFITYSPIWFPIPAQIPKQVTQLTGIENQFIHPQNVAGRFISLVVGGIVGGLACYRLSGWYVDDEETAISQNAYLDHCAAQYEAVVESKEEVKALPPAQRADPEGAAIVKLLVNYNLPVQWLGKTISPTFNRHKIALTLGKQPSGKQVTLDDVIKKAPEIAASLGIESEPFITRVGGHLAIDIPRCDRQFPTITDIQLPTPGSGQMLVLAGIDIDGKPVFINMASPDCPHYAGGATTGGGKTQGLYAQVAAAMLMYSPAELKILAIDCKGGLFLPDTPWMLSPVIREQEAAIAELEKIELERQQRVKLRALHKAVNIDEYNERVPVAERLPHILVLIDEYTLLQGDNNALDNVMEKLGMAARSEGIHVGLWTQDPVKENMSPRLKRLCPVRMAYKVADFVASSVILGEAGAEKLLGKGDMLLKSKGKTVRLQTPLATPEDIEKIAQMRQGLTMPIQQRKEESQEPPEIIQARELLEATLEISSRPLSESLQKILDIMQSAQKLPVSFEAIRTSRQWGTRPTKDCLLSLLAELKVLGKIRGDFKEGYSLTE